MYGRWRITSTEHTEKFAPILAVFFAVATVYRLYVKAAAVLYLPLLLVDLPDQKRLEERTAKGGTPAGGRIKATIQAAVGGLALFGLLGLAAWPEMQDALTELLNIEKLLAVWKAASVSKWMPKGAVAGVVEIRGWRNFRFRNQPGTAVAAAVEITP